MSSIDAFLWIAATSLLGFAVAALFAGWFRLPRNVYLLFYLPLSTALVSAFFFLTETEFVALFTQNLGWGLVGAAVVTAMVVKNVLSQPPSPRKSGAALVLDVLWPGLAYGVVDALLLSVIPVMAVVSAFSGTEWASAGGVGQLALGALALAGSLVVAVIYHLGYPEFRGVAVIGAMVGNGVMTLAFILTSNPLAALIPHAVMHVAAILHGRDTTYQLPPHYGRGEEGAEGWDPG